MDLAVDLDSETRCGAGSDEKSPERLWEIRAGGVLRCIPRLRAGDRRSEFPEP